MDSNLANINKQLSPDISDSELEQELLSITGSIPRPKCKQSKNPKDDKKPETPITLDSEDEADIESEMLALMEESTEIPTLSTEPSPNCTFNAREKIHETENQISNPLVSPDIEKETPRVSETLTMEQALKLWISVVGKTMEEAKAANNTAKIRRLGRVISTFTDALRSFREGTEFDYASLVCPVGCPELPSITKPPQKMEDKIPQEVKNPTITVEKTPSLEECLKVRLLAIEKTLGEAQLVNNTSKVRRLGRVVANFKEAIHACINNTEFDYNSLVCPPGCPPLPPAKGPSVDLEASGVKQKVILRGKELMELESNARKENNSALLTLLRPLMTKIQSLVRDLKAGKPVDPSQIPFLPSVPSSPVSQKVKYFSSNAEAQRHCDQQLKMIDDVISHVDDTSDDYKSLSSIREELKQSKTKISEGVDLATICKQDKKLTISLVNRHLTSSQFEISSISYKNSELHDSTSVFVKIDFSGCSGSTLEIDSKTAVMVDGEAVFKDPIIANFNTASFRFRRSVSTNRKVQFTVLKKKGYFRGYEVVGNVKIPFGSFADKNTVECHYPLSSSKKSTISFSMSIRSATEKNTQELPIVCIKFPSPQKSKPFACLSVLKIELRLLEDAVRSVKDPRQLEKFHLVKKELQKKINDVVAALRRRTAQFSADYYDGLTSMEQQMSITIKSLQRSGDAKKLKIQEEKIKAIKSEISIFSKHL